MNRVLLAVAMCFACAWGGAGCKESLQSPKTAVEVQQVASSVDVSVIEVGNSGAIEHPPLGPTVRPPRARRLTVDELAASLAVVAGNDSKGKPIVWKYGLPGKKATKVALADGSLASALGKPDYVGSFVEPNNPSALHLKFIDDMARDVCAKMLVADKARAKAGTAKKEAVLVRFATFEDIEDKQAIRKNLRFIKLRLLSEHVAEDDVAGTARLEKVFEAAAKGATASKQAGLEGWGAVCVAVLTSASFHIY